MTDCVTSTTPMCQGGNSCQAITQRTHSWCLVSGSLDPPRSRGSQSHSAGPEFRCQRYTMHIEKSLTFIAQNIHRRFIPSIPEMCRI